ncbi:unnamed protein product [Scytosiphon promiscuus]
MRRTCDGNRERLHEIGRIQNCGYLFAMEEGEGYPSGMGILCASANIAEAQWINATSHEELPGKDLDQVFQPECVGAVRSLLDRHKQAPESSADHISPKANRLTSDINCRFRKAPAGGPRPEADKSSELVTFALAGSNPGVYLVEMELRHGPRSARAERSCEQLQLADLLTCIPIGSDPKGTTGALCERLVQMMPAYDRGMVYRFAPDGSGNVIHETRKANAEIGSSYLDFRFPAKDIPPQARELFKQVGVRFVADTHAPGVPINFSSERGSTLDLAKCTLRAPSECHLRYLRNMGVKASMVVAINIKGELWGLFVFHSYKTPVHPSCEERIMAETAAAITASLIERHEREESSMGALSLLRTLEKFSNHTRLHSFLAAEHRNLLKILDADSILLCGSLRSVTVYGSKDVTLTLDECEDLRSGKEDGSDSGLQFKRLAAGGVAFFSVRSFLVVFLRGSVSRHVKWAGDPDLPLNDEEPMHPRASFEMFMETAVADFNPWSPATVELLRLVRHGITSQLHAEGLPADVQETFAHVSHELRTPFHGVMGALEILAAGSGTMGVDEQTEIIDSALRCGGSMMGTLNEILDIAKDRNNSEVAQGLFRASRPVQVAVAAMSPFATTEAIELVHDADTGVPNDALPIVGDERRIKAIVQNLINNAIKFTPRGGKVRAYLVVLDLLQDVVDWWTKESERFGHSVWMGSPESDSRARESEPPRAPKWHVYCVEDSGIGVLPADLPHLVTAYKQVSHGPAKSHPGTGLGLHICRAHVAAMSGALGIASTFSEGAKSGGTLFAVVLPLCPAEPASAPQAENAAAVVSVAGGSKKAGGAGASTRCPDIGARKIAFLVVDDNSVNVKLISHKIRTYFKSSSGNVQVISATSSVEAINKHAAIQTAQGDPDAPVLAGIFIDFYMPEGDGIEFTKRIRLLEAEKGWPRLPIYGCTADATVQRYAVFKDAGADGVLPKPWVSGQLEGFCNAMVAHVLNVERQKILGGKI